MVGVLKYSALAACTDGPTPRIGRNPTKGERVEVLAKYEPHFKVTNDLIVASIFAKSSAFYYKRGHSATVIYHQLVKVPA